MKKRIIALLLSLVMLTSLLTPTALATEGEESGTAQEEVVKSNENERTDLNGATENGDAKDENQDPQQPTTGDEEQPTGQDEPKNEDETKGEDGQPGEEPKQPEQPGDEQPTEPEPGEETETPEEPEEPEFDAEAVYAQLMACETVEEMDAIAAELTEEQIAQFSDDQLAAIEAHYAELKGEEPEEPEEPESAGPAEPAPEFTNAGPIFTEKNDAATRILKAALLGVTKQQFGTKVMVSPVEGLEVSKTAKKTDEEDSEGNPLYQIDLSAAAKSNIVTTSTPCDIVLVLDRSGSMEGDNVKALIKALNGDGTDANPGFLATIQKNSPNSRVAIVTYAGQDYASDSTIDTGTKTANGALVPITVGGGVNPALTDVVAGLATHCDGGTWAEYGLENAVKIFQAIRESTELENVYNNQRVTILFTDGIPGGGEWNRTAYKSAQGAIHWAHILKNDKGKDTDLGEIEERIFLKDLYKQDFYDPSARWPVSTFADQKTGCGSKVFCVGLNLPSSDEIMENGEVEHKTASSGAKVNEYLYRVSSHRSDGSHVTADTIQNAWERENTKNGEIDWSQRYWDVYTRNRPEGSYFANGDTSALSSIFQKIAQQTGKPIENAVIRDYITPGFDICDSNGNIYQVGDKIEGGDCVGTVKKDSDGVYVEWEKVTLDPGNAAGEGKKEFQQTIYLKPNPEFWGGNQVPTNIGGISGVYDESGKNIGSFPMPNEVDVPLNVPGISGSDRTIYYGSTAPTAGELFQANAPTESDSWKTAYVTIGAPEITGSVSNQECGKYTGTITVSPKYKGTYESETETATAWVHVLKPAVTWTDCQKYYGDTLEGFTAEPVSVTWTDSKHKKTATDADQATAPVLSYEFAIKDSKTVMPNTDVYVSVTTKINGTDVISNMTYDWQRASFCADNEGALTGAQFRIHPLTCTLTISKSGWVSIDENQSFLFKYQRTGGNSVGTAIEGVVTVQGNESVQITGLPIGTYQVSEDENWSWRYTPKTKSQSATLTTAAPAAALTFENSRSKILWLNGCSWTVNNWGSGRADFSQGPSSN